MADHADFPDIYVDGTTGGVGSAADPLTTLASINWSTGGDNSIYDYLAGSPAASPTIHLAKAATWRETMTVGASGTAAYPIVVTSYGAGADPIINGADLVTTWTSTNVGDEPSGGLLSSGMEDEVDAFTADFDGKTVSGTTSLTVSTAAGTFYSGLKGGKVVFDGANTDGYAYKTVTSSGDIYIYMRFKIKTGATFSGAKSSSIITIHDAASNMGQVRLASGADGVIDMIQYRLLAGVFGDVYSGSGGEITTNTWYEVEARWYQGSGGADGGGQLWLDGNLMGSNLATDLTSYEIDTVRLGSVDLNDAAVWNANDELYFDDIKVDTSRVTSFVSAPANTWSAALTTEPVDVDFDNEEGTEEVALANLNAAKKWFWDSNVLYVYAASDPDALYVAPGIEAYVRDNCIFSEDKNYITLDGIEVTKATTELILFRRSGVGSSTDIIIRGMTAHDNAPNLYTKDGLFGLGIYTGGVANVLIDSCTVYNTDWTGIAIYNRSGSGAIANIIIRDCTVYDSSHNGIDWKSGDSGNGGNLSDLTVLRCLVYGHAAQGIYAEVGDSGTLTDCKVYYCISHGNVNCGYYINADGNTYPSSFKTYNNVFYGNGLTAWGPGLDAACTDSLFKNNICAENNVNATTTKEWKIGDNGGTANVSDYNLIYKSGQTNIVDWDGNTRTFSVFQSTNGQEASGMSTDPLMTDPANGDFTLQFGSRCINFGISVGLYLDYLGLPVPIGHRPDIGAYEHKNGSNAIW